MKGFDAAIEELHRIQQVDVHHGEIAGFLEGGLTLASEAESDGETGRLTIRFVEP